MNDENTRKIDGMGRIVLPKAMRNELRLKNLERVSVSLEGDAIVVRKYIKESTITEDALSAYEQLSKLLAGADLKLLEELKKGIDIWRGAVYERTRASEVTKGEADTGDSQNRTS